MFYLYFLMTVLLALGLLLSVVRDDRFVIWARLYRISVSILATGLFTYYFFIKSIDQFAKDSLTVQVINKLPFPLDFYIVKINEAPNPGDRFETRHVGKIRTDYYRIDYLDMSNSEQFWLVGYMGNKTLVYFTQHAVPNKNEDQIIEVRNYIMQSSRLADSAKVKIDELKHNHIITAIWMTLGLLLLFLNVAVLLRREK